MHLDVNMFYYVFLFGVFIVWQNFTDAAMFHPSDPALQATDTAADDCLGYPNSLSIYYPVLVRNHYYYTPSRFNIQLDITVIYPDGLRNNRIFE